MTVIEKYLPNLRRRAHTDWISARLLWNIGFIAQAIWLIQQSIEKYLKVLWAHDKVFSTEKELTDQLKKLGKGKFDSMHDIGSIFHKLDLSTQYQLGSPYILQIKSETLRYSGSFVYGEKIFNSAEAFIKSIRKLLNEDIKISLYEEIKSVAVNTGTQDLRRKQDSIFKEILSLKSRINRKKLHKQIKRLISKSI